MATEMVSIINSDQKAWFEDSASGSAGNSVSSTSSTSSSGGTLSTGGLSTNGVGANTSTLNTGASGFGADTGALSSDISNGEVFIQAANLDHDLLKVTVKCSSMENPVLGIAFHLLYDKDSFHFLRYDPGNFLEKGGDPFYIVSAGGNETAGNDMTTVGSDTSTDNGSVISNDAATDGNDSAVNDNGEIIFGQTLRRNDSFPVGGGDIVSIYFQKIDGEVAPEFQFKSGVVSTLDTTRQDIDNVRFIDYGPSVKSADGIAGVGVDGLNGGDLSVGGTSAEAGNTENGASGIGANAFSLGLSSSGYAFCFLIVSVISISISVFFFLKYKKIRAKI